MQFRPLRRAMHASLNREWERERWRVRSRVFRRAIAAPGGPHRLSIHPLVLHQRPLLLTARGSVVTLL